MENLTFTTRASIENWLLGRRLRRAKLLGDGEKLAAFDAVTERILEANQCLIGEAP